MSLKKVIIPRECPCCGYTNVTTRSVCNAGIAIKLRKKNEQQAKRIAELEADAKIKQSVCNTIVKEINKINEELEAELEKHRWIPVNLGPPYNSRPKESGKILILTDLKKIIAVYITVGEDEFINKDGKPFMCPTHSCFLANYGSVLLGEDKCITHWKPIFLPEKF